MTGLGKPQKAGEEEEEEGGGAGRSVVSVVGWKLLLAHSCVLHHSFPHLLAHTLPN